MKLVVEPHLKALDLEKEVYEVKRRLEEYERRLQTLEVTMDFIRRYELLVRPVQGKRGQ